jgi:hypothetical protein
MINAMATLMPAAELSDGELTGLIAVAIGCLRIEIPTAVINVAITLQIESRIYAPMVRLLCRGVRRCGVACPAREGLLPCQVLDN